MFQPSLEEFSKIPDNRSLLVKISEEKAFQPSLEEFSKIQDYFLIEDSGKKKVSTLS